MECQCWFEILVLKHCLCGLEGWSELGVLDHVDNIHAICHFTNNMQQFVSVYSVKGMRKVNT